MYEFILRITRLELGKNGSFAKLGLWAGLCGFANVPFVRWRFLLYFCSSFYSCSFFLGEA
jgi:hypothetical protein